MNFCIVLMYQNLKLNKLFKEIKNISYLLINKKSVFIKINFIRLRLRFMGQNFLNCRNFASYVSVTSYKLQLLVEINTFNFLLMNEIWWSLKYFLFACCTVLYFGEVSGKISVFSGNSTLLQANKGFINIVSIQESLIVINIMIKL